MKKLLLSLFIIGTSTNIFCGITMEDLQNVTCSGDFIDDIKNVINDVEMRLNDHSLNRFFSCDYDSENDDTYIFFKRKDFTEEKGPRSRFYPISYSSWAHLMQTADLYQQDPFLKALYWALWFKENDEITFDASVNEWSNERLYMHLPNENWQFKNYNEFTRNDCKFLRAEAKAVLSQCYEISFHVKPKYLLSLTADLLHWLCDQILAESADVSCVTAVKVKRYPFKKEICSYPLLIIECLTLTNNKDKILKRLTPILNALVLRYADVDKFIAGDQLKRPAWSKKITPLIWFAGGNVQVKEGSLISDLYSKNNVFVDGYEVTYDSWEIV